MKSITILLFGNVQNDSRVKRTIKALSEFHVNLLCRDFRTQNICQNAHFYHNRYTDEDIKQFEPEAGLILKFIKKLLYYINTERIKAKSAAQIETDIYYCNDFNTLISGFFASRRRKAKLIYDTHELWAERMGAARTGFNRFKRFLEYFIEWFIIRRCDLVITVSDGIADELVGRYNIERPLVIRNLDVEKELPSKEKIREIRHSLNIPEDCILIVYQGGLSDARGIPELIESIKLLPKEYHLLLMGNYMSDYSQNKINNNLRIHYPGLINENELFVYTASCDIGIVPYKTENLLNYYITFPNKFSQFLNAGLAVILYDSLESRKIVNRCNSGLILDNISSESIKECVLQLTREYQLTELKKHARECFLRYYNWGIDKVKLLEAMRIL